MNGVWRDSNGKEHQLFHCEDGKGLFYPAYRLELCKQDQTPGSAHKTRKLK